jgi:exodeoxyribonuclease VII large subunit
MVLFDERMEMAYEQIRAETTHILSEELHYLQQLASGVQRIGHQHLHKKAMALSKWEQTCRYLVSSHLERQENYLQLKESTFRLLDPSALLARGYTLTTFKGRPLQIKNMPKPGDTIETFTLTEKIHSKVENIESRK